MRLFLIAVQFMTRVPVPVGLPFDAESLNRSARHFAGVGAFVGAFAALVLWAAAALWPMPVAVLLSMAATIWLTGAFHEDGLADTCDALGGAVSRERALVIMKDSRIGTYGAAGLVLVLALKAAALSTMPIVLGLPLLVLAHTASRAAATIVMWRLPYAGDAEHAKAKPLAQQVGVAEACGALVWTGAAVAATLAFGLPWFVAAESLLAAAVATLVLMRWFRRRIGGFTGDTLGATQQFTELAMLLAASAGYRAAIAG